MKRNDRRTADEDPVAELVRLANELDLTALALVLPSLLKESEQRAVSYSEFTRAALRAETSARRERKLTRGLKRSRLGTIEGLQGFDFSIRPQLEPRVVKELTNCAFVEEGRNVICVGKPGLGKTRIAKVLAHAAALAGHSVLFTTTAVMLEDLHASLVDGSFRRTLRRYVKPALLVADEFGYESFDKTTSTYLFRLISERHGKGSIILTANTGFTKWTNFFPSEAQAVATVDRLLDRATILRFSGKTCRQPRDIHGAPLEE
jgi:DNA replication protein DnaC